MDRRLALAVVLGLAATDLGGCAPQCGATDARIAGLQRGMTVGEVEHAMGCPGANVPTDASDDPRLAVFEWDGPRLLLSVRTRAAFQDDRLLYVYSEGRGGL
jgi:hypothetical protein